MKEERINIAIIIALLFILAFVTYFAVDLINDKTNYILELQKENNQCELQLDSITQDYVRLQNE